MKAGHPYLTKELDELRATQRRCFRGIPDWVLEPERLGPRTRLVTADLGVVDAPLVETLLRAEAEKLITQGAEQLAALRDATEKERGRRFVYREVSDPGRELQFAQTGLTATFEDLAQAAPIPTRLPEELAPLIRKLVLVLAWADELADDEYADPRIVQPETPGVY